MQRPEASGPERTPYGPARVRLYLNGEATVRVRACRDAPSASRTPLIFASPEFLEISAPDSPLDPKGYRVLVNWPASALGRAYFGSSLFDQISHEVRLRHIDCVAALGLDDR
jgi:hypothetical protein